MTIEEAIQGRRSIRRFRPDEVPVTTIREMLGLASNAPSIGNRQMWRFVVISDDALRRMLARLVERRVEEMSGWAELSGEAQRLRAWKDYALHFTDAPVVIAVVNSGYRTQLDRAMVEHGMKPSDVEALFGHPDVQSVSAVIAYFTLLATARGLATCWLTYPLLAKRDLSAALELKSGEDLTALIALGYGAETPPPRPRRAVDEIIEWR